MLDPFFSKNNALAVEARHLSVLTLIILLIAFYFINLRDFITLLNLVPERYLVRLFTYAYLVTMTVLSWAYLDYYQILWGCNAYQG